MEKEAIAPSFVRSSRMKPTPLSIMWPDALPADRLAVELDLATVRRHQTENGLRKLGCPLP